MRVTIPQTEIEKENCCICYKQAKHFCPFCVDEYDTAPRVVPTTYYCNEHYVSVVETGNCCYGSEQVYSH